MSKPKYMTIGLSFVVYTLIVSLLLQTVLMTAYAVDAEAEQFPLLEDRQNLGSIPSEDNEEDSVSPQEPVVGEIEEENLSPQESLDYKIEAENFPILLNDDVPVPNPKEYMNFDPVTQTINGFINYQAPDHVVSQGNLLIPSEIDGVPVKTVTGFEMNHFLTTLTIEEGVENIGYMAFSQCGLTEVNLPNSLKRIEDLAFAACGPIAQINLPDSLTYIGKQAFYNCEYFTEIEIPSKVAYIGEYAFDGCTKLESITFHGNFDTLRIDAPIFNYNLTYNLQDIFICSTYEDLPKEFLQHKPWGLMQDPFFWYYPVVTLDYSDGSGQTQTTILSGFFLPLTQPKIERDGWEIESWYTDPAWNTEWDFTTPIRESVTLYAKWKPLSHVVSFVSEDEAKGVVSTATMHVQHGKNIPNTVLATPINGYVFDGWYVGDIKLTGALTDQVITGTVTYTAKFIEQAKTHTVTFASEDETKGTISTAMIQVQNGQNIPSEVLVRPSSGYEFDGWYLGNVKITGALTDQVISDDTLYIAKFRTISSSGGGGTGGNGGGGGGGSAATYYSLEYETNGGTPIPSRQYRQHTTVELTDIPTKNGFFFEGWYADAGLTQKISSIYINQNEIVYAKWTEVYTVLPDEETPNVMIPPLTDELDEMVPGEWQSILPVPIASYDSQPILSTEWNRSSEPIPQQEIQTENLVAEAAKAVSSGDEQQDGNITTTEENEQHCILHWLIFLATAVVAMYSYFTTKARRKN